MLDVREVRGTAGQSRTGLWTLYLQSIIFQKYFQFTCRKMTPEPDGITYFYRTISKGRNSLSE